MALDKSMKVIHIPALIQLNGIGENDHWDEWKPAASKPWLVTVAGIMWSGVGLMLCHLAYGWLLPVNLQQAVLLRLVGVVLALIIYRFGFRPLAEKNIQRIGGLVGGKICLFAFQEWKSYPLVVVMVAMGITLREYSLIPKPYLAILYIGIGGGLFVSSLHYYWNLRNYKDRSNTERRIQEKS